MMSAALQRKSYLPIPFLKLRGLSLNIHIHVSVSDLYIPRIGPHIWLQQNRQTDPGNIKVSHRYMSVGVRRQNAIILFWKWWGCTVSFLGIHKWEQDIYIGFSPALRLQWVQSREVSANTVYIWSNWSAHNQAKTTTKGSTVLLYLVAFTVKPFPGFSIHNTHGYESWK